MHYGQYLCDYWGIISPELRNEPEEDKALAILREMMQAHKKSIECDTTDEE